MGYAGFPSSYPYIEMIQRTGLDTNQNILRTDRRRGQILIRKIDRSTMRPKKYGLHRTTLHYHKQF